MADQSTGTGFGNGKRQLLLVEQSTDHRFHGLIFFSINDVTEPRLGFLQQLLDGDSPLRSSRSRQRHHDFHWGSIDAELNRATFGNKPDQGLVHD